MKDNTSVEFYFRHRLILYCMMFVSSEVDDQKEEEKEDKLKHHSLFTVFVMCCTFVYATNTFYYPLFQNGCLSQPSQLLIVKTKKRKIFQLQHKKMLYL